ncbi:MAG: EAL domain-containing protein [Planctomycetes bacterium]|nr:EAL domain-containing protein [Planctomycetota bacterium]
MDQSPPTPAGPAQRTAPLVLLAAAQAALRAKLHLELERAGWRVALAADAAAALSALERLEPDALVLGPADADPAALAACASLRRRGAPRVVLLLTAQGDTAAIERAFDVGATEFAALPLGGVELALRLRFALRGVAAAASPEPAGESALSPGPSEIGGLLSQLRVAMEQSAAKGRHAAVLCAELVRFKELTAGQGEDACEALLADVARRLRVGIRDHDVLARLGCAAADVRFARLRGDEFCVMLRDVQDPSDVAKVGQRILDLMAEPFVVGGRETCLAVSIGIACFPDLALSAEGLLEAAEKAAYCAKQERAAVPLYYTPALDHRAAKRLALEVDLRHALERGQFALHYQPQVEIQSGRIVGAEALVRWFHPERGRISPLEFVPLAEETGLIVPLGEWILREACRQNKSWQQAGFAPLRISVNLSPVQFRQPGLFESVERVLQETGLDARWLEFEITETLFMSRLDAAIAQLKRFRDMGVHLSVDDFGTGYSSLSYLKRLPLDTIKIDQSFIRELATSSADSALVTAIILMCRSLKLSVVAEGVETRSQLALLRILQCDQIQGYLVSRPVPAEEFAGLLSGAVPQAFAA